MTPDEVASGDTHDLRRRVLRANDATAPLDWPGDDEPTTFHLAFLDSEGTALAISTWLARPDPERPDRAATQLRGMATDPAHLGNGLASGLLAVGIERCRTRGDASVWANARVGALSFYERAGFSVVGAEFTTPETGLRHQRVRLDLD